MEYLIRFTVFSTLFTVSMLWGLSIAPDMRRSKERCDYEDYGGKKEGIHG